MPISTKFLSLSICLESIHVFYEVLYGCYSQIKLKERLKEIYITIQGWSDKYLASIIAHIVGNAICYSRSVIIQKGYSIVSDRNTITKDMMQAASGMPLICC